MRLHVPLTSSATLRALGSCNDQFAQHPDWLLSRYVQGGLQRLAGKAVEAEAWPAQTSLKVTSLQMQGCAPAVQGLRAPQDTRSLKLLASGSTQLAMGTYCAIR